MKAFDEERHQYHSDGIRLPGATDIIKSEGLINLDWMSDDARWRGKAVHLGVKLLNKGTLDWSTVDETVAGYLKSYQEFLRVTKFKIIGFEEPVWTGSFACIPDLWGYLNGLPTLIEIKSGPVPKWAAIQTALQAVALRSRFFKVQKRFGLQLMADGSLSKLIPFDNNLDDECVAVSMVGLFHWKLNNGYITEWRKQ